MARRSSKRSAKPQTWIDSTIRLIIWLIAATALAFAGLYAYNYFTFQQALPINDAIRRLEEQVRRNPLNGQARVNLGAAYLNAERWDDAINQFEEALKIDKESQGGLVGTGIAFMKKEKADKALGFFKTEIDLYWKAGFRGENKFLEQALYYASVIYWSKGDYKNAINDINRALTIRGTDADTWFLRGRVNLSAKKYKEAAADFTQAITFDPMFSDAHYGLGTAYEKMGIEGNAIARYHQAVEIAKKQDKNFAEAQKAQDRLFNKIKARSAAKPNNAEFHYELGIAYFGEKKYAGAMKEFNRALDINAKFAKSHYGLGLVYRGQKKNDQAIAQFNKAIKLSPNWRVPRVALTQLKIDIANEKAGTATD